jgi:hypothetical protein
MNPRQYQPYYLIYFFNEVMRLVCVVSLATEVFLVNRFVRKIRLKIRFVEAITILFLENSADILPKKSFDYQTINK